MITITRFTIDGKRYGVIDVSNRIRMPLSASCWSKLPMPKTRL